MVATGATAGDTACVFDAVCGSAAGVKDAVIEGAAGEAAVAEGPVAGVVPGAVAEVVAEVVAAGVAGVLALAAGIGAGGPMEFCRVIAPVTESSPCSSTVTREYSRSRSPFRVSMAEASRRVST